jgi:hypothetical protein
MGQIHEISANFLMKAGKSIVNIAALKTKVVFSAAMFQTKAEK